MTAPRPVTVITGASAGIGAELARVFARHGHALVLLARRTERLETLAAEIAASGAPPPLVVTCDLLAPGAVEELAQTLAREGVEPQYLVNNAGFGLVGTAVRLPHDEQLAMIDLNVRVLTELSLRFAEIIARHRGGILNVASVAAFVPGPGMAVYYASKAYVLSFSEALSAELKPFGVRVTALCPGPVATEFAARAGIKGNIAPGLMSVPAEIVAAEGYRALMAGRRRAIPGLVLKVVVFVMSLVPNAVLLGIVGARQARRRGRQKLD
ncbi:MAG: SDR family NAD(P)-dependent oxidoreductase [Pseudolabrys sp.]